MPESNIMRPARRDARDEYAAEWAEIERLKKEIAELAYAMARTLQRTGTHGPRK